MYTSFYVALLNQILHKKKYCLKLVQVTWNEPRVIFRSNLSDWTFKACI